MLFDTHCHLFDEQFRGDLDDVVRRAQASGVTRMVIPGVDANTSRQAIAIAERYDGVFAAAGIHPESLKDLREQEFEEVRQLLSHPKVVAVGEIGLDYYWNVTPKEHQQEVFSRQIKMAREAGLPIIIHNRDATEDTVRIIETECAGVVGVMHCFTGSYETALRCIKHGFYISFGGPATFKNAENVRKAAIQIPDENLLVETDSPYLAPHPHRGTRNEPERVRLVAEKLAEIRGQSLDELEQLTTNNGLRLFARAR